MNYIRTKDGRIIAYDENSSKEDLPMILNYQNQILAQADTIEELCDEFVLVDETLPPHLDRDLKEICRYKIYISGSRGTIYGAIWTNKGLIYVAKMNDKGELELI